MRVSDQPAFLGGGGGGGGAAAAAPKVTEPFRIYRLALEAAKSAAVKIIPKQAASLFAGNPLCFRNWQKPFLSLMLTLSSLSHLMGVSKTQADGQPHEALSSTPYDSRVLSTVGVFEIWE